MTRAFTRAPYVPRVCSHRLIWTALSRSGKCRYRRHRHRNRSQKVRHVSTGHRRLWAPDESGARVCAFNNLISGEVAEWLKALAWKASVRLYRTAGSNPALSARYSKWDHKGPIFDFSPSVVEDEDPVRPTQQRSCQLAGSPRSGRANPALSASLY